MKKHIIMSLALLFSVIQARAAVAPAGMAEEYAALTFGRKVDLRAGTPVLLELSERIQSDAMTVGQLVKFKVSTDVVVEGRVAIRTGALALGRVKAISPATYNNPEEIHIEVTSVQAVDGQQVALNGLEQVARGTYPGQGMAAQQGMAITASVMNDVEIKTN
ncbi:MAG: hypothetical protein H6558_08165 [Lewinellaceae bacterium]|nr:hypothetical protein [Lewinellaceae bacterium]